MVGSDPTLVIGGTRGTGLLIARLLHGNGVRVRVLGRYPTHAVARLSKDVDLVAADVTKPETLLPAIEDVKHIIFTAGVRSGRPARETSIKAVEYEGVVNVLKTVRQTGFRGRFMYMTASGAGIRSFSSVFLNLYKGNTLVWRTRAENEIRASGLDYTIIRTGILLNRPGGRRALVVTQADLPLSPRYRVGRADVAETFVAALEHPCARRATFEVVWGQGPREGWDVLLGGLRADK